MLPGAKKRARICENRIKQLVGSVAESRKEISEVEMKNKYLNGLYPDDTITTCCKMYGLDIATEPAFITWPVFLGTSIEEINLCAVNFGALTLFERKGPNRFTTIDNRTASYINAAINTLVVTSRIETNSSKIHRYWPTRIDFTNKLEAGTLNQTTLSLSSLLRFGFLDPTSNITKVNISDEQLLNRYRFVIEGINWILNLQKPSSTVGGAWSYAEDCKEASRNKKISSAILPSQFCYEVISKYYEYFKLSGVTASTVRNIDDTLLQRMESSCNSFEKWIENEQREDGGYRRNSNHAQSSLANSCCALLVYAYNDDKKAEHLNGLVSYLFKSYNRYNLSVDSVTDLYKYKYKADKISGYVEDAYEIFPEALLANNSIKAIDDGTADLLTFQNIRRLRAMSYVAFESILDRFGSIDIDEAGGHVAVKGRQEMGNKKFPIYVLYFSKICLEKLRNNDQLSYKKRKKYIAIPLFMTIKYALLALIGFACALSAYFLDATNTLTTILLSIASFIAPFFLAFLRGENKYRND